MQECVAFHPECQVFEKASSPSRLVQISKNSDGKLQVRLQEDVYSKSVSYAALSYTWGAHPFAKTTKQTLESWKLHLPWNQLPKSVHDAIAVTYELGLSYLWIDSLCIVQDDESDKEKEISTMARVYSQAHVVIVASRAEDAHDGFLHRRDVLEGQKMAFELPFRCRNGDIGSAFLLDPHGAPEPLDGRAWALQERLLARRTLDFGSRQTRFACRRNQKGHRDGWTPLAEFSLGRANALPPEIVQRHSNHKIFTPTSPLDLLSRMISTWRDMVYHYTERSLSIKTDRILAICAIAERYSTAIPGPYLAGLWYASLPADLLWQVTTQPVFDKRPAKYQGPSWSWVSVDGPVMFLAKPPGERHDPRCSSDLEIIKASIKLRMTHAKFGAVDSGRLTVKGRLQTAEWAKQGGGWDQLRLCPGSPDPGNVVALRVFTDAIEADTDGIATEGKWRTVHLLLVQGPRLPAPTYDANPVYSGLMLHRQMGPGSSGGNATYSRLGVFLLVNRYDHPESKLPIPEGQWRARLPFMATWFDDCAEEIIDLI